MRYNDQLPSIGTPKESVIVKSCIHWLLLHRCFVWRHNTGAYTPEDGDRFIRYGKTGSPDIIGLNPQGRFLGIECKRLGKKQTDYQVQFQCSIEAHSGIYVVATSVDDLEARKQWILS